MASPLNLLEAPIPRPLLWIGVPIAAFVLITVLVFLRFPYGAFAPMLSQELSRATGADVSVRDIEPRLTVGGPGMAARHVRVVSREGDSLDVDPLMIRPAWSTSWLRLDPALKVQATSDWGDADGVVVIGDLPGWNGEFEGVELAQLPLPDWGGVSVAGTVNAAADVSITEGGAEGPLSFDASNGRIEHPALPIPIEYERITADLVLGGENVVDVRTFELDGPIAFATAEGVVSRGPRPGMDALDLAFEVELKSVPMRAIVQGLGVRLDQRGRAQFKLGGTTAAPRVQ